MEEVIVPSIKRRYVSHWISLEECKQPK